jgi:hypothetical protein
MVWGSITGGGMEFSVYQNPYRLALWTTGGTLVRAWLSPPTPDLESRLRQCRAVTLITLCNFMAYYKVKFIFSV